GLAPDRRQCKAAPFCFLPLRSSQRMCGIIGVTGNHEYDNFGLTDKEAQDLLSILWRPQFRFTPEPTLSDRLQETVYTVRYGDDLEVFVLNSNIKDMSEQAEWLDAKLTASDARWRVVTMHHPIFSSGRGRDNPERRELLLPILLKHEVDLALQGHDHTYARGNIPAQTPERTAATNSGDVTTMFVNSVSGPKMYEFNEDGWDSFAPTGVKLERKAENTQFFQVLTVDGDSLRYAAHTADGEIYDAFELTKSEDGAKTLTNSDDLPEERMFRNTLPYSRIDDR
ncbi:MAG: metallophosphoesterase, partial [Pseudomonadota bacterium]